MLRLLPFCFLLTSCGLLQMPARIVHSAGATTKRAVASTQKFGKDISNKYFKKDEKEDAEKTGEPTEVPTNKNYADLPEDEPYTPAPVRNTVFIPNKPTSPGVPAAPVPETTAPKVPAAPPLPGEVDLPDLPPLEVPE